MSENTNYTELNLAYPFDRLMYKNMLSAHGREDALPQGYVFGEDIPDGLYKYYESVYEAVTGAENAAMYRMYGGYQYGPGRQVIEQLTEEREQTLAIKTIERRLSAAPQGSAEREKLLIQQTAMEQIDMPDVKYSGVYQYREQLDVYSPLMLAVLSVFIIAPVFSHEFDTNMYMILSSARGDRRLLFWYKLLGAMLISTGVLLLYNALCAFICFMLGTTAGGDTAIASFRVGELFPYVYTPYDMTVSRLFTCRIIFELLRAAALTAVVSFFSLITRSSAVAVCVGETLLLTGALAREMRYGVDSVFSDFSLTNAFVAKKIFDRFDSYSIFGRLIPYPTVYAAFLVLIAIAFITAARIVYAKRRCNEVK